jgi:branched-chain amino acid aminotransferase
LKFPRGTALYIRPFLWSTEGWMQPDPASTRIAISLTVTPMPEPKALRVMLSRFRRPSPETAPTDAKAVCLYAQAGRAAGEAAAKGFDDAVMLDPLGNVAEFSASNLWIAKDGAAITPAHNGCFLNGITRQRLIKLFQAAGVPVYERSFGFQDVLEADEVFSSGNYGKVLPITGVEDRAKPIGPIYQTARRLYWDFAHRKN